MSESQNEDNRRCWSNIAQIYAGDSIGEDDPVMRSIVRQRFIDRLRGKRVLEVGCGPGTDSAAFTRAGLEVTATDYAQEFVDIVKERYPTMAVRRMDMCRPDLPAGGFDGVYGFASFLHLPRAAGAQTIAALANLLLPGGLLCLTLIKSSMGVRDYTIDNWGGDAGSSMHFTCYEESEAINLAQQVALVEVELFPVESALYERMPRLVERGIQSYQLLARRSDQSPHSLCK